MSSPESKINDLLDRLRTENAHSRIQPGAAITSSSPRTNGSRRTVRPNLPLGDLSSSGAPVMRRPHDLTFSPKRNETLIETDRKLKEIMKISGKLTINGVTYQTDIKDMEHIEELGNGTCGHVIKMRHKPSGEIIAVKQMRRSGNSEENKRIIMDIEVVIKSHDCEYIVQCLGCFITESEVWICMELMATCFDKLLKRLNRAIPEEVLGKVTVATVKALSYLKEKHGVIHRDVKPSNILLDEKGNVKLCDFGISGRLVDSMAKTRSAGCAAYMAPERIEPDPKNPDYDIRADVWSLGITLVELATGMFPYQDCKTDFEVLTKVIGQEPPSLPADKDFSPEFRTFVACCLIKDQKDRPKYVKLRDMSFIKKYETVNVNVGEWFAEAMKQADFLTAKSSPPRLTSVPGQAETRPEFCGARIVDRGGDYDAKMEPGIIHSAYIMDWTGYSASPLHSSRHQVNSTHQNFSASINGNSKTPPLAHRTVEPKYKSLETDHSFATFNNKMKQSHKNTDYHYLPSDGHSNHISRFSTFHQRDNYAPYAHQSSPERPFLYHQSTTEKTSSPSRNANRSYSPFQTFNKDEVFPPSNRYFVPSNLGQDNCFISHIPRTRPVDGPSSVLNSAYQSRKCGDNMWQSPSVSPLPLRSHMHVGPEPQYNPRNTSPIVLQRFHHQQKQQQQARENEEARKCDTGKKRFASYIKLQLGGERSGRSSRQQSPEPPPRLSRNMGGDNQSPLALRRNFLEDNTSNSPSLSRRYISPSPPVPPPRRLSESNSVPGSPQHLRARFHYTPEPQRRLFHNNDVS